MECGGLPPPSEGAGKPAHSKVYVLVVAVCVAGALVAVFELGPVVIESPVAVFAVWFVCFAHAQTVSETMTSAAIAMRFMQRD